MWYNCNICWYAYQFLLIGRAASSAGTHEDKDESKSSGRRGHAAKRKAESRASGSRTPEKNKEDTYKAKDPEHPVGAVSGADAAAGGGLR